MSGLIYWTKSKHTRSRTPCRRKLVVTHVILKYITWHLCLLLWNRELSYTRSVLVGGIFENQITLYSMHITVFTPICLSDFLRCPWSQNANEQLPIDDAWSFSDREKFTACQLLLYNAYNFHKVYCKKLCNNLGYPSNQQWSIPVKITCLFLQTIIIIMNEATSTYKRKWFNIKCQIVRMKL